MLRKYERHDDNPLWEVAKRIYRKRFAEAMHKVTDEDAQYAVDLCKKMVSDHDYFVPNHVRGMRELFEELRAAESLMEEADVVLIYPSRKEKP